jgi:mannose-6-phosphate isomerase
MPSGRPELLTFGETYFERIWGGTRLGASLGRPVPPGKVIGEAWLISDHDECQSVVDAGPWAGKTLGRLMAECPEYLLGTLVKPTPRGQFPLLLKLIDAGEALSVQVHPDDETARRLNEPDVGKTEMWYVMEADPGAELVCGLVPGTTREAFATAVAEGRVDQCMTRFPAPAGTSVFVPAGTVHAIGGGILLAEIQQNSNITYRVHDWNRVDANGKPRQLHLDKAMEAIDFGSTHAGPSPSTTLTADGQNREVLGACRYFVAERMDIVRSWKCKKGTESFHLVVAMEDGLTVLSGNSHARLVRGGAVLVPGGVPEYTVAGAGEVLVYCVPEKI